MTPFLNPGDVVALNERAGPEEIQIGDVIAFQVEGVDTPMTHRVAAISNGAEEITFRTRGDASREVDPWTVKPDQVLGRVIYSVPQLGYLTRLSRTPEGFALLVLLPAVAVLVLAVRDLARRPYSSGDRMGDHQERGLQPASGGFKGKASTTALSKGDRRLP
jgi:signal peptidase